MNRVIVCEPRADCADPNINRYYCMKGHDGAAPDVCPLAKCAAYFEQQTRASRAVLDRDAP